MQIISPAFEYGAIIPVQYSCDGENVNPPLQILNVPASTKSLVLIMDDPDASVGTWTHWTIWNISPDTKLIAENSVPENAVQGTNSAQINNYRGPCPPSGTHRYFFKLFALDIEPDIAPSANIATLNARLTDHILATAELMGRFAKP
jgi:hypothetical protein